MYKSINYWIDKWQNDKIFNVENDQLKPKSFYFSCFPKAHLYGFQDGEIRPLLVGDFYARLERMKGNNVLYPTGIDMLGKKAHEELKKYKNDEIYEAFHSQMLELGIGIDEEKHILLNQDNYVTSLQLAFLELFERGYIKYGQIPVIYDVKKKQIYDFYYEYEGSQQIPTKAFYLDISHLQLEIESKIMELEISEDIKKKLCQMLSPQRSITLPFYVTNGNKLILDFKEPQYMGGISYILLHPDYIDFSLYTNPEQWSGIEQYLSDDNTNDFGVFTGNYAINPLTGKKIPIYVSVLHECPIYVANPYLNQEDRKIALDEGLPVVDVVQNGVFIESDFLNGIEEEKGKDILIDQFLQADMGEVHTYYSKEKILLSSLDIYGVLFPVLISEEGQLYPMKDKLPFTLNSKFKMVLTENNNIAVNKVDGSINEIFSMGMLPLLSLLYDEMGDCVSIFSKETMEILYSWNSIKLFTVPENRLFESVFFPLCILAIIEKEKGIVLPPLLKDIKLVGSTLDAAYQPLDRSFKNLLDIPTYIHQYSSDAIRVYFFSKTLEEDFAFDEAELSEIHSTLLKIDHFYHTALKNVKTVSNVFQEFVEECEVLLNRRQLTLYVDRMLEFFKTEIVVNGWTLKEGLLFLKLLYPMAPFMAEDLYHEIYKGKYLLSDAGWIF